MKTQRDIFIDQIYKFAKKDKDIQFLSADFGAPSLDRFRADLPDQFLHVGISEQNMIDVAAGMSLSGKKVYVYAMGPFITLRCLEQLKCSLAQMNLPVTVISVGLGLGYADAGPTHYITEDLACLRSIVNFEIFTPSDLTTTKALAKLSYDQPSLRVFRLDRNPLDDIYEGDLSLSTGYKEIYEGDEIGIFSCGYVLQRIWKNWKVIGTGNKIGLIDIFQNKPINIDSVKKIFKKYPKIITVEEQCQSGGFGSSILESVSDLGMSNQVKRLSLQERYYFENGGRDFLLDQFGLSLKDLNETINLFN